MSEKETTVHTAWVMGGGGHRLAVDLVAKSVTVGVGMIEGYAGSVPVIMLSYTIRQLNTFLPALQEMKQLEILPKVHLWNRTKTRPGPELRVDFRIPCAGHELLSRYGNEDMLRMLRQMDALTFAAELFVSSSGNTTRESTERFFRVFNRTHEAIVVVNEDEDYCATAYKQEISLPVAIFAIERIEKFAPLPFEYDP